MLAFAETVRGRADGAAPGRLRHVVNIGIGGSDLGPQMVVRALADVAHPGLSFHFVANVDGADLASVLAGVVPAETLFVVASKTFTTQETMTNAETARAWFVAQGGTRIDEHFVAATSNVEAAARFGITRTFGFWDWVGGRYSLWSAIGLPIAIAIGAERFRELLAGARAMDEHFAQAPVERNVPMLLGLVDVWYRNFHGFTSRCIAPYAQALQRLPAYLQQLEMESNGKRVDRSGAPLPFATSPVVWGEPGTNAQHAYFQMLHQGSDVVPVEFILLRQSSAVASGISPEAIARQHRMLLANGLAQSQALMQGRASADEPHRDFPGNRPSTTLLLERADAALARRAARALRAPRLHLGRGLGHRQLRPVGRRARQDARRACSARCSSRTGQRLAAGALDASTAGLLARLVRLGARVGRQRPRLKAVKMAPLMRPRRSLGDDASSGGALSVGGPRGSRPALAQPARKRAARRRALHGRARRRATSDGLARGMRELGYVDGPQRRHRLALRRRPAGSPRRRLPPSWSRRRSMCIVAGGPGPLRPRRGARAGRCRSSPSSGSDPVAEGWATSARPAGRQRHRPDGRPSRSSGRSVSSSLKEVLPRARPRRRSCSHRPSCRPTALVDSAMRGGGRQPRAFSS